jgi:ATP-dependent protease ClpP protease subunit
MTRVMKSNTRQLHAPESAVQDTAIFVPRPDRTLEWLGGVTYDNLRHILSDIKSLMIEHPQDEIHLLVNSYGGATGIGMSFYDAMTAWLKPNLTTIGSGDVDSSGIIVFLSGHKRYLTKNTTMLLHLAGRTFEPGKRFSTSDMVNMLTEDKLKDYQYASVVAAATNGKHSPEKILDMMAKNTILTPQEAVNMGLAHKVL